MHRNLSGYKAKYIFGHSSQWICLHVQDYNLLMTQLQIGVRGYPEIFFLISPQKHMLWVLIRSASVRHF